MPRGRPEPLRLLAASGEAAVSSELSPAHSSQDAVHCTRNCHPRIALQDSHQPKCHPAARAGASVRIAASRPAYRTPRSNLQLRSASNTRAAAAESSTARTEGTAAAAPGAPVWTPS